MFKFYTDETSFSDSLQKTDIKKNNTNVQNNYRPVSMSPYLLKAFEKYLYEQIYAHIEKWRPNLDQGDIPVTLFTD